MVSLEKNDHLMLARQLPLKSVALILAGGRGTRLKDLTNKRAKPAVHFGGKFRIIDFALSNCINSGIRRMGVITQYQSHTLVQCIDSLEVRKKPGGHWIIRDLMGLDLVGLASL